MAENKSERKDQEIEANATLMNTYLHWKPLKIFFFMFKLIGMNLDLNTKNKRLSTLTWVYFILILPIPIFCTLLQIFTVCCNPDLRQTEFTAMYNEQYVLLSAMLVVALRHSQINELVIDSLNLLIQFSKNKTLLNSSMIKAIILCAIIGIFDYILETYFFLNYNLIPTLQGDPAVFTERYFALKLYGKAAALATNLEDGIIPFQVLFSHLFCALLLFIMFIINQSYRQLNENFKTEEEKSSKTFMTDHMKMAKIVQRFNQVFSPAMLVVILIHMMDLVASVYIIYNTFKKHLPLEFLLSYVPERMIGCIKVLIEFIFLTKFGQEIKNHAQDSLSILLEADISNENVKDSTTKNSYTSNLYTATMTSSPVTICANCLVVDYDLVKIIVSIAIAYVAFIESFGNANKNCNNFYNNNYYCANETSNLTVA